MKKAIKTTIVLAVTMIITKSSIGQKGLQLNLDYNISTPLGSGFKDYVSKSSTRSFQGSVLYGITEHIRVGAQIFYADYHRNISTGNKNIVKSVPLLAKGEYTFLPKGILRPFVGVGAGFNFVNYKKVRANIETLNHYTKGGLTGDAGVLIAFTKTSRYGVRISSSYNLMPLKEEHIRNLDSWNVQAGICIPLGNW